MVAMSSAPKLVREKSPLIGVPSLRRAEIAAEESHAKRSPVGARPTCSFCQTLSQSSIVNSTPNVPTVLVERPSGRPAASVSTCPLRA